MINFRLPGAGATPQKLWLPYTTKCIAYLAESVVCLADVGARVLQVGPWDRVTERGRDKPARVHPFHLKIRMLMLN